MSEERDSLVYIHRVGQPLEATLIQVELAGHGIDSELDGEHTVLADPLFSQAVGGIQILVHEDQAEQARQLVEAFLAAQDTAKELQYKTCPSCAAEAGEPIKRGLLFGFAVVLTVGIFSMLHPFAKYRCTTCNAKWR